ncbi:Spy/CpxP family protein refolding chaperone [Methylocapsa sp. S129]|uniref:Spy/CpxP family protein refolding chaperone n=1 Tax=Methylocapsa sp. S129 TaxID=1641869 RepID=UPI00131B4535|nr:Spy/CpxP family protein refolding chaperone [Methylocapsa sp. S129]
MRKLLLASVALAGLASATFALNAFAGDAPTAPDAAQTQRMMDNHAVLLEAHLAGMKAGLKLTAEQEKNWPAFESAIRDAAKAHAEGWRQMHEHMDGGERPSPIEHMTKMSEHLQKMSAELKMVADAGKPLYDSLDDSQKRHFGPLLRDFLPRGPHEGDAMRHEGEGGSEHME